MQQLNKKGITVSTYNKVDAEPTNIHVLEALSLCKEEKCDFIIGIGGGSCIDAAKAVAVYIQMVEKLRIMSKRILK